MAELFAIMNKVYRSPACRRRPGVMRRVWLSPGAEPRHLMHGIYMTVYMDRLKHTDENYKINADVYSNKGKYKIDKFDKEWCYCQGRAEVMFLVRALQVKHGRPVRAMLEVVDTEELLKDAWPNTL